MLTLQQIKADPARTIERLAIKGFDGKEPIAKVLQLDEQRRALQLENDNLAAELNRAAASIGALMKQGKREEAEQAKATVASLKERQKGVAQQLAETEMEQQIQKQQITLVIDSQPSLRHGAGRHIGSRQCGGKDRWPDA